MKRLSRRIPLAALLVIVLSGLALPAWADRPAQTAEGTRVLTGTYETTNPIYPTIGAESGIVLYDLAGQVLKDFDFRSPPEAQVLGTLNGDIVSGTFQLTLPAAPNGTALDFDGDPSSPPAVQVFAAATYINFLGDDYLERGETPLDLSVRLDPMTFNVIGGHAIVWAAEEGEKFPSGVGADGTAFTADDPLLILPAGWSVVSLNTDPYTVLRDSSVDMPIIESFGGLYDYSALGYAGAWEALFQRTRETYPFTVEKNLDWQAIYDEITPLVAQAETDLDFHLIMARFGALIPDTHIGYVSVQILQTFLFGGVGVSRIVVTDTDELVIATVTPDFPADQAGIEAGDVLTAVDGIPALQALDETPLLLTSASTEHGRRFFQAATMLQGPVGSQVNLTWRTLDGSEQSQAFTRVPDFSPILTAFGAELTGDVISSRMLDSGLGYIRVSGFAQDVSRADAWFAGELQSLIRAGATGLIIDVRDNGGGLVQLAMAMAGRFFSDYERLFDFYYADGDGGFAYRGFIEVLVHTPYYEGPVAVLVNEMTGSAGDIFAYAMQMDDRAIIVGPTPSGGFAGEVGDGQYTMPGGLQMQIPTGRPISPITGETLIEGVGVIPDVRVPVTRESILSPEDETLLAAEAALLEK